MTDVEPIHDDDLLYRRFHPTSLRLDGTVDSSAFTQHNSGEPDPEISVDLARKTTPEKTLADVPRALVDVLGLGALKGLLETEPPKEKQEKKTPTKQRKRSISKKTDKDD